MTLDPDDRTELATKWQLRARVKLLESTLTARSKRMDDMVREVRQTTKRAQTAHERIDEFKDSEELLGRLLEQVETLTGRVDRMAAFCQKLKDEREAK